MDQCKHCIMRGCLKGCMNTLCNQHESWLVQELKKHLQEIRGKHHGDDAYNIASDALGLAR